jgi:hypothetical protein
LNKEKISMISEVRNYVELHAERGACQCGRCIDAPPDPGNDQPSGHTADTIFFKVRAVNDPTADELWQLVRANRQGEFNEVDLFDGTEHNYLELGGWIGNQGVALMLMGLGNLLGLWDLLTPRTMLPAGLPDDLVMQMAGQGYVAINTKVGRKKARTAIAAAKKTDPVLGLKKEEVLPP